MTTDRSFTNRNSCHRSRKTLLAARDRTCSSLRRFIRWASCFAAAVLLCSSCSRQPIYPPPVVSDGNAVVDISALTPETPQFFTYQYRGKNISFFVIRMNGGVQSYFDACVTCYPKKRGYQNKDGYIECRACDMRFSVYKLEKGMGGCYPIKLEGRMENGRYLIPVAALEKMEDKF